jgi:hypothetical protein
MSLKFSKHRQNRKFSIDTASRSIGDCKLLVNVFLIPADGWKDSEAGKMEGRWLRDKFEDFQSRFSSCLEWSFENMLQFESQTFPLKMHEALKLRSSSVSHFSHHCNSSTFSNIFPWLLTSNHLHRKLPHECLQSYNVCVCRSSQHCAVEYRLLLSHSSATLSSNKINIFSPLSPLLDVKLTCEISEIFIWWIIRGKRYAFMQFHRFIFSSNLERRRRYFSAFSGAIVWKTCGL